MSILFFYDTETTGLPVFAAPSADEQQPHLVQACAALVDSESRQILQIVDLVVAPDGWEIPAEVTEIHGITTDAAAHIGISESLVTEIILNLWRVSDCRIGHNEAFDARILRIALFRHGSEKVADEWKATPDVYCTSKAARSAMGGRGFPSLTDAHQHFCGRGFDGSHTARGDVEATINLYFSLKDHGL